MCTRFWSASTGYVILVGTDNQTGLPLAFPLDKLDIEKEVCLWIGYLNQFRPVTQSDLGTSLLRVFVGVIENVQDTQSVHGGYTVTLQLRDRMKYLMDTSVTYNPAVDENSGDMPYRSDLILEIAQRGIGQVEANTKPTGQQVDDPTISCSLCGKSILWDKEYLYDLARAEKGDQGTLNLDGIPPANVWYQKGGPLPATTRTTSLQVPENPSFRIFTTRAAINLQQSPNFLVNQQVPIDVLKFLASQEVYPTEVFQDHRDGNFYYSPRANDATGLSDPKRFFRTYFFNVTPPNGNLVGGYNMSPPDVNQMLMAFRSERSSIGLKTNFWVHKNAPAAQGGAQDDWTLHLRVRPQALANTNYACKFARIYDPTITTAEEAAVVALNAARILAKETRAATAIVLGDPSITPGEVVQVIGSAILPQYGLQGANQDRQQFLDFDARYNTNLKTYAEESLKNAGASGDVQQGAEVTLPLYDGSSVTMKIAGSDQKNPDALICNAASQMNPLSDPPTLYRVEAIIHRFNVENQGFQTELALSTPF
jgi:hypothetical protein